MLINVYDFDRGGDPHGVSVDGHADVPWETVLYVPVPRWLQLDEIEPALDTMKAEWRRSAQAIVLRIHRPHACVLASDQRLIDALGRRFEGRPILLCTLDDEGKTSTTSLTPAPQFAVGELHQRLARGELDALLTRPGVLLPANDDFHYEGPNGQRYESFIRVGTALQGPDVLESLAFWLVPLLGGRPVVVLDSWTIISIGYALSRYVADSGLPDLIPHSVETPTNYDSDNARLEARLKACCRVSPEIPVLVVSSVSSTGRQHDRLIAACRGAGFGEVRDIVLYGSPERHHVISPQESVGRYWTPKTCPLKTPAVPIAKSTYLLEAVVLPARSRIALPNAMQAWSFFDRYKGTDCLSVHRDQSPGDRHHTVYLEVLDLVDHPEFRKALGARLAALGSTDIVVVCPHHPAAIELASVVRSELGCERIICDEDQLHRLDGTKREILAGARRILIVDDVVITGARLRGYRQHLLDTGFLGGDSPPEIHLLVGVARVDDNTRIRGIADMVDDPGHFHPVETVLLPHWDDSDCPWCFELALLRSSRDPEAPHSETLAERFYALTDTQHGLHKNLFLPWGRQATNWGTPRWELGPGSIFHTDTEGELYAAVASAVQSLRAAGDLRETFAPPLSKVLDPIYWMDGRYYDAILTACLLRSTRRHDLRATPVDAELIRGLDSRLADSQFRPLRAELLLASGRGHLPTPSPNVLSRVLLDPEADPAVATMISGLFDRA